MKIVLQRIKSCSVFSEGKLINKIGNGALILLGISKKDTLNEFTRVFEENLISNEEDLKKCRFLWIKTQEFSGWG